jgi:hypothetical protein
MKISQNGGKSGLTMLGHLTLWQHLLKQMDAIETSEWRI